MKNSNNCNDLNLDKNNNYDNLNNYPINEESEKNVLTIIKHLKMQLIKIGKKTCSVGIDFSFNILKNVNKIDFCLEAPSFCEASDGLNVICYCRNIDCHIYNELFVNKLGI